MTIRIVTVMMFAKVMINGNDENTYDYDISNL